MDDGRGHMTPSEAPPDRVPDKEVLIKSPGFWENALRRFRKNRLAMLAYRVVIFLVFIAVFADFLAYNKPIYCKHKETTYFPLFADYLAMFGLYQWDKDLINADWKELELESAFWPPVRYMPDDLDYDNQRSLSPFEDQRVEHWKEWHFLGTDRDGRDILSGLIHGTRYSLSIGLVAMAIAAFIGILLGAFAGYFGDHRWQLSTIGIIFLAIGLLLGFFYGFQVRSYTLRDALMSGSGALIFQGLISIAIATAVTAFCVLLAKPFERIAILGRKRYVWVDIFISRLIEVVQSIPALLLIISIMAITEQKSIYLIMIIIGLLAWTGVARFMRGEMLRVRSREYIEAARSLGLSEFRVLFRHALPNAIAPVLIVIAFGVAGAIVTEAALSFLGLGVPDDIITWGKLLREGQNDISAWWLTMFPSLAIFLTVTSLNLIGEGLRDALDPKLNE